MAWNAISGIVPQFTTSGTQANGYVIKFYEAGTTTPLAVATDDTGGTTATNFLLDTQGYATSSGNIIIPHVNADYKIVLYLNQADADANATGSAVYVVDNVQGATATAGSIGLTELFTIDNTKIIIGGTSANAQYALSGDVTMTNGGVVSVNSVQADSVVTASITDANVTTAKILDANVTKAKLASNIATGMPVLLSTTTPTNANSVDIDISSFTSTYKDFSLKIRNVKLEANDTLGMRFSVDGGTVFYTGGTDYRYTNVAGAANQAEIEINDTADTILASTDFTADISLPGIGSADSAISMTCFSSYTRTGPSADAYWVFGTLNVDPASTNQLTDIRLFLIGGSNRFLATGTIELYGVL